MIRLLTKTYWALLVPAALCALLFYPLKQAVYGGLLETRDSFVETLEEKTGMKILYGGASPSVLGGVDISDIKIFAGSAGGTGAGGTDGEEAFLSVRRLRLKYSLWDLLRGNFGRAVKAVVLEEPALNINSEDFEGGWTGKGAGSLKDGQEDSGGVGGLIQKSRLLSGVLPEGFVIKVKGGVLNLGVKRNRISASGFTLNASVKGGVLVLKAGLRAEAYLRFGDADTDAPGKPFYALVPVRAEGRLDFKAGAGAFNIELPELSTEYFSLYKTRFLTVWSDKYLELRKTGDRRPYDISLFLNLEKNDAGLPDDRLLSVRFAADNFSPGDIIKFNGRYSAYNVWLGTKFGGRGSFEYFRDKRMVYKAAFSGAPDNRTQTGGGMFELDVSGNEKAAVFKKARLALARGTVSYAGSLALDTFLPNGNLVFDSFCFTASGNPEDTPALSADFNIFAAGSKISIFADTVSFGGTKFSGFGIDAQRNGRETLISFLALRFNNVESYEDVSISRISANAKLNSETRELDVNGEIDSLALIDILNVVRSAYELPLNNDLVESIAESTAITTGISLHTDFKTLRYRIPHFVIAYNGFTDIIAVATLNGTNDTFVLEDCHIAAAGGIDLKMNADYTNMRDIKFDVHSLINTVPYTFEGTLKNNRNLDVTGSYNFFVSALLEKNGAIKGTLKMDSFTLPFVTRTALLSADADFVFLSKKNWNVTLDNLALISTMFGTGKTVARISGSLNQDRAWFPGILLDDGEDPLRGSAKIVFTDDGRESFEPDLTFNIQNANGREELAVNGSRHNEAYDIHISANDFRIYRFFLTSQAMSVSGQLDLTFNKSSGLNANFNIDAFRGRFAGNDLTASTHGVLTKNKIEVSGTGIQWMDFYLDFPYISIDREQDMLQTTASLRGVNEARNVYADLKIESVFAETSSWSDFSRALRNFSGTVYFNNAYFFNAGGINNFNFNFSRQGRIISISGGPEDMLYSRFSIDDSGNNSYFYASLSNPAPVQGTITGDIKGDSIDVRAHNLSLDLKSLGRLIPPAYFIQCKEGFAYADITITGSMEDPSVTGIVQGYNVVVGIPDYIGADIGPAPVTIRFADNKMAFDPFLAPAGGGLGYITGAFELEKGIPKDFEINVDARKNRPLPYSVDISGIIARGLAWGNISFTLEGDNLTVTGELTGSDSSVTLNWNTLGAVITGDITVQTDLVLNIDRKVEFMLPSSQYPIVRASANMGDSLKIESDSSTGTFSLTGNIKIKSGEILWFQRNFYIREGEIIFNQNEINLTPRLTAVAESRDQNEDGPVTLLIRINNQPITNDFQPVLEADPPLTQVEIFSLLGSPFGSSGISGQESDDNSSFVRGVILSTADALTQFQLIRRVQNRIRDFFHVDMFSARTQALQNFIIQNYLYPEEESPRLGTYFDNSSVLAGKYLAPNLYVQSMVSTVYDKNQIELGGVSFETYFSVELNSPLFNTRWEINPQITPGTNPLITKSLFVRDTSITISKTWHLP